MVIANAYRNFFRFPLTLMTPIHLFVVRHFRSSLWGLIYRSTGGSFFPVLEPWVRRFVVKKTRKFLSEINPSVIVSCVPIVNNMVGDIAKELGIPFVILITEIAEIHPAWLADNVTRYCVANTSVRDQLALRGVPSSKMTVTGYPARPGFFRKAERRSLRRKLGVSEDSFLVLLMGGGEGLFITRRMVSDLSSIGGAYVCVFAGWNESLKKKLARRFGDRIRVLPFVENMDEWMHAADLLITKCGPTTLVEAAATKLPSLVTAALPGQEQSIIDTYLPTLAGGRDLVCKPSFVRERVVELMGDVAERNRLVAAVSTLKMTGASRAISSVIHSVIDLVIGRGEMEEAG